MNNKVVLKIVVICAAVFIVFGIIAAIFAVGTSWKEFYSEDRFSFGKGDPFEYHKNESFNLIDVDQINVGTVSTNVVLYESENELEVTLDCSGYAKKETITLETEKNNGTVIIEIKYPRLVWNSFNITQSILRIGIPSNYSGSLQIDGLSSDIDMSDFLENEFTELDFDTVSGNATIRCALADIVQFHSISGELSVKNTVVNTLNADTTSGDINVSNLSSAEGNIVINTTSGRVFLVYDVLCKTRIDTVSGDVNLDIPNDSVIDLNYGSVSGDISGNYNTNTSGVFISVHTTSGDLKIN